MGTSHKHIPSIVGQPNWGKTSAAVTGIANAVDDSNQLDNDENNNISPSEKQKRQNQYTKRIVSNYHHAIRNLVRASGGRQSVSSGSSRAVGHAGVALANGIINVFQEIAESGLSSWLHKRGIESLEGKTCKDVLLLIREYLDNGVAGLDNTAANEALEYLMDQIEEQAGDDISKFDELMNELMSGNGIKDLMDQFFGMYIFCHLSQDFAEKIGYEKGIDVMNSTLEDIRDLIMDDVSRIKNTRDFSNVDWSSPECDQFIKNEFNKILYILSGNED